MVGYAEFMRLLRAARQGRLRAVVLPLAAAAIAAGGCASLRRQKVVPDSVATCRQLSCEAAAAMERGQPESARQLLESAVAASPGDIDARRQLAEVLWKTGARQEALVHMQAAVQLDSRHAPTLVRSGEMFLALGSPERAMARAEQAIALDKSLAGAWALRGRVHRQHNDFQSALADLQQALRYGPNDGNALQDVAEIQYQLGRPQRCLSTLQYLFDSAPPGQEPREALWLAGVAYRAVDRREDAVASLYAASTRGEPQPELLYQLAQAQCDAGRPAEAAVTARQALAANSGHQASRALLAQLEAAGAADAQAPLRR
jgi:Tfp pilus assembly protein PilF